MKNIKQTREELLEALKRGAAKYRARTAKQANGLESLLETVVQPQRPKTDPARLAALMKKQALEDPEAGPGAPADSRRLRPLVEE